MEAARFLARLAAGREATDLPVLIVVAHPDDEVIGLGGQLPRLRGATLLHVTDGAPRDGGDARAHGFAGLADYAAARRRELHAALALAGIGPERALELGLPDQQAALHLAELARRIGEVIADRRPALVITQAYEGGHPDHDATAFAVQAALHRLGSAAPPLLEMAGYHAGPQGIEAGCFLPSTGAAPVTLPLDEATRALKRRMIACFASQQAVLQYFPVGDELFRVAPAHDFAAPPHPGRLFYEGFPWGMTGGRFRALAAAARQELAGGGAA